MNCADCLKINANDVSFFSPFLFIAQCSHTHTGETGSRRSCERWQGHRRDGWLLDFRSEAGLQQDQRDWWWMSRWGWLVFLASPATINNNSENNTSTTTTISSNSQKQREAFTLNILPTIAEACTFYIGIRYKNERAWVCRIISGQVNVSEFGHSTSNQTSAAIQPCLCNTIFYLKGGLITLTSSINFMIPLYLLSFVVVYRFFTISIDGSIFTV